MATSGILSHIDVSVGDPTRSIRFYDVLLGELGFTRLTLADAAWSGDAPQRATWRLRYAGGACFEIEVRPARAGARERRYDRYQPGPHHIAFHADSEATVDRVHRALLAIGAEVLDAPAQYGGTAGYGDAYYAAFFADPDGLKLEVCHIPRSNP